MGHALEIIQADAFARLYKMIGKDVIFQTWTDEHGSKIRKTAKEHDKDVMSFLNENVKVFKEMYKKLNISYDNFIRTSDKEVHRPGAIKLRNKLEKAWDIYKKQYTGLYCSGCESFKTTKELKDGKCPNHPTKKIEKVQEENYFFKLSKYAPQLIKLISEDKYKIYPKSRKHEILTFLAKAEDISFSREKNQLPRGIPVPNDPDQVMYVRCDALSNYITGQGYGRDDDKFQQIRPADIHIIWKDILRFHAAFWPAMLLSAQIELPKKLIVHGFVTINGQKMGKSTGNVVDPLEILKTAETDAFKFTILYDAQIESDADFSEQRLNDIYNSMLIWGWGNLINRVTKLSQKYGITQWAFDDSRFKKFDCDSPLFRLFDTGFDAKAIDENYLNSCQIKEYLQDRYQIVQKANEFIQNEAPRKKYKDDTTKQEAIKDLQFLLRIVKNLALLSSTILTNGFTKIQNIFWNPEFSQISTKKTMWTQFQEFFNKKEFPTNLNPEIIYQKKE